ncbi:CIC11C00000004836 [Sungouiella intermedia]|uniref:CIC11C00000004836 n=1 Tax=Sungouiella intermedia TaxID=45354 RepID=A0A1L0D5S2_9ASCO|nr:CIC11C00000004836 [[Candida] intermedia]
MSRSEGFSSSDEENYAPRINLPNVNLASNRKKDKSQSNFSRAKKKFSTNKAIKFPDLTNYRGSYVSNSSNVSSTVSSDVESDPGSLTAQTPEGGSLPNFWFNPHLQNQTIQSEDSEASDTDHHNYPTNVYDVDSSEDEGPLDTHYSRRLLKSLKSNRNEMDITDIQRTESGSHLYRSSESRKGGIKLIFRKMSLVDQAMQDDPTAPSRSDTFLGRVLNFGGGGMSGGGLAPGASKSGEDTIDEEKEIGGQPEDHLVEMKNLNFAELNEEAQNLILAHAPEVRNQVKFREPSADAAGDSAVRLLDETYNSHEGSSSDHDKTHSRTPTDTSSHFYQPNPDLLREDLDDDLRDDDYFEENGYVAPPKQVHAGVLSSLLKLYQNTQGSKSTSTFASQGTTLADEQFGGFDSGYSLKNVSSHDFTQLRSHLKLGPKKLAGKFRHSKSPPQALTSPQDSDDAYEKDDLDGEAAQLPSFHNAKPKVPKSDKKMPQKLGKKLKKRDEKLRITVHIADILQRQRFIVRMCRALMMYGAPTHRLEEYMVMTSRVLEIDGQFVYFPGTMIVAFGDAATRTSEVHLVRCAQGLNLSKLSDTHKIYKDVIHDLIGVEEASLKLEELMKRSNNFSPWKCVLLYGLGSACVCTWGFGGGWLDIPVAFGIGLMIGYLQFFMSSMSNLYSSVFEVTASIVVSFLARGIGSIRGGNLFCFGAIAQGSLALILPGYIILCGSLELQSKNLVAGSVRMFYAIIYSLFLGFGITLGAALYGWVDSNATDAATCSSDHSLDDKWRILFVPLFSLCLGLINQARWRQTPVMILISSIAYVGTYFAGKHFSNVTEFTAAIGAFIIGILGNMYSRLGRGMAVAAMLPAIFVQVPSGIASKSTLLAGVDTANKITNSSSASTDASDISSLSFGATMVEVSIGISVGLFAAAIVVYPFGKRRTGLFTM